MKPIAVQFERKMFCEIPSQHFNAIDLGLPSGRKWADKNVGAYSVEIDGLMMDFDTAQSIPFEDGWHLPTKEDFIELVENTDSKWTLVNGVPGREFISRVNGNKIFLPASGWSWFDKKDMADYGTTLYSRGTIGYYWSSSYYSATGAYRLYFNSEGVYPQFNSSRRYGFTVRAVQ